MPEIGYAARMSRAFVKEQDGREAEELPDRPGLAE